MNKILYKIWIRLLINISHYIDSRVSCSSKHSAQVAQWVTSMARRFNMSEAEVENLYWAALFHDIGKIGIPEGVLSKAGPLTDEEWKVMRLHPAVGANIVKSLQSISHIAPFIYYHQEKFDGTGYPEGLRGNEIPLQARILAVVDAYDAMTNDRYYRKARSHSEAIDELQLLEGKHFDTNVVKLFLEVIDNGNGNKHLQ